jgi:hypothetical protein
MWRAKEGRLSARLDSKAPAADVRFPPVSGNCESRPYHNGWILHAWPSNREKKSVMHPSFSSNNCLFDA